MSRTKRGTCFYIKFSSSKLMPNVMAYKNVSLLAKAIKQLQKRILNFSHYSEINGAVLARGAANL